MSVCHQIYRTPQKTNDTLKRYDKKTKKQKCNKLRKLINDRKYKMKKTNMFSLDLGAKNPKSNYMFWSIKPFATQSLKKYSFFPWISTALSTHNKIFGTSSFLDIHSSLNNKFKKHIIFVFFDQLNPSHEKQNIARWDSSDSPPGVSPRERGFFLFTF